MVYILKWISWKQDKTKISQMHILKTGKKQDISNLNLANQEGNKNIKMHEIENLVLILLYSVMRPSLDILQELQIYRFHQESVHHSEKDGLNKRNLITEF